MAGIVVPLKGLAADTGASLKSFFGMQVASSEGAVGEQGGFCIWAGMSSLAKIALHYAVPFAMAVVLGVLVKGGPAWLAPRFPGALAQLLRGHHGC